MIRPISFLALALGLSTAAYADEYITSEHSFVLETITEVLEHPWGLDFLPEGRILVTERPGRLRIVEPDGTLGAPLSGMPMITSDFRDGLLDVTVSPTFAEDNLIYFAYSELEMGLRWLKVVAAHLRGDHIHVDKVIFEADVRVEKDQGFGSRIRFDADGNLMITVGDHAVRAHAQDATNTLGSIIRIRPDGSPAEGNPGGDFHPAIYAYGFKNPQGLAIGSDGTVWSIDHGGVGGGELNDVAMGANYGWPARTFGGADAPGAEAATTFAEPTFTWGSAPTVALSGLEIYEGDAFPNPDPGHVGRERRHRHRIRARRRPGPHP